jgi:hypothetical protein
VDQRDRQLEAQPRGRDPSITAADLFTNQGIPTYVVAIGEAQGKAFADKLAMAGGTNLAIDAVDNAALVMALKQVIADVQKNVVAPVCTPGLPRIMVLLDASSSMLNVANKHAGPGVGGWERPARPSPATWAPSSTCWSTTTPTPSRTWSTSASPCSASTPPPRRS